MGGGGGGGGEGFDRAIGFDFGVYIYSFLQLISIKLRNILDMPGDVSLERCCQKKFQCCWTCWW